MHTGTEPIPLATSDADAPGAATVVLAVPGMLIAEALARLLREHDLRVVGCYGTLDALLDKIRRCRPSVVIVDADFREGPDGAAALLSELRAAGPDTKLVVLAATVDCALAKAVMECGARAVILKSSPTVDAIATLAQVIRGRTSFPAAVLAKLSERPAAGPLSARQLEVLEQLALGRSNEEIAQALFISANTVKFHLRVIYDRLGVKNRVEAARLLVADGGL